MRDASLLPRALHLLPVIVLLSVVVLLAQVVTAAPSPSPSPSTALTASSSMATAEAADAAANSPSSSAAVVSADEQARIGASLREWYTSNFYENETQLLGIPNNRTAGLSPFEKPCAQLPSLQTRSSALTPNGRCPPKFENLSCTCLTGYVRAGLNEFWEFKVMKKTNARVYPQNQDARNVLEIDAIATLWVPETLKRLYVFHYFKILYMASNYYF